jgi:hypothetical protein
MGYGLDDRSSIPNRVRRFYLLYSAQTGPEIHPASYPIGISGDDFPRGKSGRGVKLITHLHLVTR